MPADHDPTDIVHEDAERARRRLDAEIADDDFRWLMQDKRGRRFMWRLLEQCGVNERTFRLNAEGAFLEGRRSVGLDLQAEAQALTREAYVVMLQENLKVRRGRARDTDRSG